MATSGGAAEKDTVHHVLEMWMITYIFSRKEFESLSHLIREPQQVIYVQRPWLYSLTLTGRIWTKTNQNKKQNYFAKYS